MTAFGVRKDHRLVPVVPGDRFQSRARAYGKPCASQRCMHGLEGGVGTSSAEVFHAYPTETLRGSVHESPVRHLPHAHGYTVKGLVETMHSVLRTKGKRLSCPVCESQPCANSRNK